VVWAIKAMAARAETRSCSASSRWSWHELMRRSVQARAGVGRTTHPTGGGERWILPIFPPLALSGSVIGGLTSLAASWVTQNAQAHIEQRIQDKSRRQELYKTFIEEASKLYGEALMTDKAEITTLVNLYAMVSRMRVLSALSVVHAADAVVRLIIETYFEPNKTLRELREILRSEHIDPLHEFSEACRDDLRQFRSA